MERPRRPLNRLERSLAYGLLGWSVEITFTAARQVLDRRRRDWRLEGHTYLWMLPIYGLCAVLFEPMHDALAHRAAWQRAAAYAAGFVAVEWATGSALRRGVGLVPWDYSGRTRFALAHGATRLDYAPLWAVAGLALERVHDTLRTVPVRGV